MKKSVKKNYIYNVIYQILCIILPIITTPYVSRVLLPEGVGQYSFSYAIINYFVLFASLGFGIYAQREIAKYQDDKQKQKIIFWEVIICRLIPVVLCLIVNILFVVIGVYSKYNVLMLILTINVFAVMFDISFYFQGNENFGKLVLNNIIIRILGLASIFLFVKDQGDVWVYTLINAISTFLGYLIMWGALKKEMFNVKNTKLKPFKHFKGTFALFLPTIATSIYVVLDKVLIGLITGSDAQNGFYEQSEKIVKLILTIVTCVGTVMIPRNSNEFQKNNIDGVKKNIYDTFHFVWLIGLPLATGLSLIASNFVPWFFGAGYEYSVKLIWILSPLIVIIGISSILGLQYIIPSNREKLYTISVSCGAVVNLMFNIPLIYYFGAVGASISTVLAEVIGVVIMFIFVRKELSIKKILATIIKPLIATVVMAVCLIPLVLSLSSSIINTFIIVVVGMIAYGATLLILKDSFVLWGVRLVMSKLSTKKNRDVVGASNQDVKIDEMLDDDDSLQKEIVDNVLISVEETDIQSIEEDK